MDLPGCSPLIIRGNAMQSGLSNSSASRGTLPARLSIVLPALVCLLLLPRSASAQSDGGKYLDAKFCSDSLNLNPGSDYDGGSCQLWRLVPDADGWSRLQLKRNGKFLDAKFCRDDLNMNPGSTYDNGACQLWRFVPAEDGWARLQIKRNGKFLDASYCSDQVKLSEESDYAGGACQLWRLVPTGDGWARLQIKYVGEAAPLPASDEEFAWGGHSYGWYDDGWNGPGYYIIGFEFRSGRGWGGREGWRGWHHRGSRHGHITGHHEHAAHHNYLHFRNIGHHGAVHFRHAGHGGPHHFVHRSGGGGRRHR